MELYFKILAVDMMIVGAFAAYYNIRMAMIRTGYRKVLRIANAVSCFVYVVSYSLELLGQLRAGTQVSAALMRPAALLMTTLMLSNALVNLPTGKIYE